MRYCSKLILSILLISPLLATFTYDDYFDSPTLDSSFWYASVNSTGHIMMVGGNLRLILDAGGCGINVCPAQIRTRRCFQGDFDASLTFDVVDVSPSGGITPLQLIATQDCVRRKINVSWSSYTGWHDYRGEYVDDGDTVWAIISSEYTSDLSGAIRMTRVDSTFSFYYRFPFLGWVLIDSFYYNIPRVWIGIRIQNQNPDHPGFDVAIDSFHLEADTIVFCLCHPPVPYPGCMNENVRIWFTDDEGVYAPSLAFTVDGVPMGVTSPGVTFDGTNLDYVPSPPWAEGTVHQACVTFVEDVIGNAMTDDTCWDFTVDLTPPELIYALPPPGSIIYNPSPMIEMLVRDNYHPIATDESQFIFNRLTIYLDHPLLSHYGDTLRFNEVGTYRFTIGDTVELCLHLVDDIPYCPGNDTDICWIIIEGDSIRPNVRLSVPDSGQISSCTDQPVYLVFTDNTAIDTTSVVLAAGGGRYIFPDNMSWLNDSTLVFYPPFSWAQGYNTICVDSCLDIWGNESYDMPQCFSILIDYEGPTYSGEIPVQNDTVRTVAPEIRIHIADNYRPIIPESLMVILGSDTFRYNGSLLRFEGDSLIFDAMAAGAHFSGGNVVTACVSATDSVEFCAFNRTDTCWQFVIAPGGPMAYPITPQPGEITSCIDQPIIIHLDDTDGIYPSTISLFVSGMEYTVDSTQLTYSDDTLTFTPSFLWNDAETVVVQLLAANDSLDNPISTPLDYIFVVDLRPPSAQLTYPAESTIIRDLRPTITINIEDAISPVAPESASVVIAGDTVSFGHRGVSWDGSVLSVDCEQAGISIPKGDTAWVELLSCCDLPDLCESNCTDYQWFFVTEAFYSCLADPNPFSPNGDDVNEQVFFCYPGQALDAAELTVFNRAGEQVFTTHFISDYRITSDKHVWNGNDDTGKPLPAGIYLYTISIKGEVVCSGTITLVR